MIDLRPRIGAFFDILLTRNVVAEIAAVAACLWVGWLVGATLRNRYQRRGITTPTALTFTAPVLIAMALVKLPAQSSDAVAPNSTYALWHSIVCGLAPVRTSKGGVVSTTFTVRFTVAGCAPSVTV